MPSLWQVGTVVDNRGKFENEISEITTEKDVPKTIWQRILNTI